MKIGVPIGFGLGVMAGVVVGCGPAVDVAEPTPSTTGADSPSSAASDSASSDGPATATGGAESESGSASGGDTSNCTPAFEAHHRAIWVAHGGQCLTRVDIDDLSVTGRFATIDDPGTSTAVSVALSGDALVVNDGALPGQPWLVKITGDPSRCNDDDGVPGIQTSRDAETLPWGQDECVAWVVNNPGYERAGLGLWGSGAWDPDACS